VDPKVAPRPTTPPGAPAGPSSRVLAAMSPRRRRQSVPQSFCAAGAMPPPSIPPHSGRPPSEFCGTALLFLVALAGRRRQGRVRRTTWETTSAGFGGVDGWRRTGEAAKRARGHRRFPGSVSRSPPSRRRRCSPPKGRESVRRTGVFLRDLWRHRRSFGYAGRARGILRGAPSGVCRHTACPQRGGQQSREVNYSGSRREDAGGWTLAREVPVERCVYVDPKPVARVQGVRRPESPQIVGRIRRVESLDGLDLRAGERVPDRPVHE